MRLDVELSWELDSEEYPGRAWSKQSVTFCGLSMHVCAIRVKGEPRKSAFAGGEVYDWEEQVAWDSAFQAELEALYTVAGGEGQFQTVELPGLEGTWVLFAHPHM